jgi:hypothetical protein
MATSLLSLQPYNYFFINLLYQPYIEMANQLICIEDVASITALTVDNIEEEINLVNKEPNITNPHCTPPIVSQDNDDEVPGLAPAPLTITLSPCTAVMVLEAAGPGDGEILLDNAKDLAATLHHLKTCLDEAHNHAQHTEDQLEELQRNKENEPLACNHGVCRLRSNSSGSSYDLPKYTGVCPQGFKDNHRQAHGFYIPNDDGHQVEPKFI